MNNHHLSPPIYTTVIVVLLVSIGVGAWSLNTGHETSRPIVYFQRADITSFTPGGEPMGKLDVMAADILHGTVRLVRRLPGIRNAYDQVAFHLASVSTGVGNSIGMVVDPATLVYHNTDTFNLLDRSETIDLTTDQTTKSIIPPLTARSADSTKVAVGTVLCVDHPTEGPCVTNARADVYDVATGTISTWLPKDLHLDPSSIRFSPLGFSPDNTTLYLFVSALEEASNMHIYAITLADRRVTEITPSQSSTAMEDTWLPIGSAPDRSITYLLHRGPTEQGMRIMALAFQTGKLTNVSPEIPYTLPTLDAMQSGVYLPIDYQKGVQHLDFASQKITTLTTKGDTLGATADGRYIASVIYETNDGHGPQRLVVTDTRTKREYLIYRQPTVARGMPILNQGKNVKNAKVGDFAYSFIGISE